MILVKKRRLTRWLPSAGFFLVVGASTAVAAFVLWIAGDGWYDRLVKPMDPEIHRVTLGQYSDYLENIAPRIRSKNAGITTIKKAISIRKQVGDEAGARRASAGRSTRHQGDRPLLTHGLTARCGFAADGLDNRAGPFGLPAPRPVGIVGRLPRLAERQLPQAPEEVPVCFWWSNKKLSLDEILEKYFFL